MSSTSTLQPAHRGQLAGWAICLLSLLLPRLAAAADVVYLAPPRTSTATEQQVTTVTRFYGLDLRTEVLAGPADVVRAMRAIADPSTIAVVIDAEALGRLDRNQVLTSASRGRHVPVLVAGVTARTAAADLRLWSNGAISKCNSIAANNPGWAVVGAANEITAQLSGSRLPLGPGPLDSLESTSRAGVEELITATLSATSRPLFVRVRGNAQELFFATASKTSETIASPDPFREQPVFAQLAPLLLFLHHAAGDLAWHSPGAYANFTIDDLWLREPYGHVNYERLLEQSRQHNFHTTIAFIPWNFDRSQPGVVFLFREHPDRLSIAIHGNDHIHQEFGPLDSHPIAAQRRNIEQSLARMHRFQQLTGVPYDPVMIFPHSVSPEATFAALKQASFLGTVNSLNVPSDRSAPAGAEFALRSVTLQFAGLPSLRRYSVESEVPRTQLAIDAFLGNPMLFYAHESFFAAGDDAFGQVADEVNQLQPSTRWTGLGEIMRHLYLERLRDDGDVAIRSYSSSISLHNSSQQTVNFWIEKEERFDSTVRVMVDGQAMVYDRSGTELRLRLPIPAGQDRLIEVRYGPIASLAGVDLSSHSLRVTIIRLLSDFRDNAISRSALGRWFIRSYVVSGTAWNRMMVLVVSCCGLAVIAVAYRRGLRNAESESPQIQMK